MTVNTAKASSGVAPRILAPQGYQTTASPAIEWESGFAPSKATPVEVEIRVTGSDSAEGSVLWSSGTVVCESTRIDTGVMNLPPRTPVYLWLRERRKGDAEWPPWNSLKTPLFAAPIEKSPARIWVYDLNPTRSMSPRRAFEDTHLVSALQGIVNRDAPLLFVTLQDIDAWWLQKLQEPEGWLQDTEILKVESIEGLIEIFKEFILGVVVWDREVEASSNVASTIAGVENLLPVTEDAEDPESLWKRLVVDGPQLPVVRDLRGLFPGTGKIAGTEAESTGSRKCDAHLWTRMHYLDKGRCNPMYLAYYMDAYWIRDPEPGLDISNHTLTNHDYFISRKAMFWDLNVWEEEVPVDDPNQKPGEDLRTLISIFRSAQQRVGGRNMIRVGGFNPWAFKYTECPGAGGTHHGVHTEWETVKIASEFDALIDADALHLSGMANASFYQHYPLPEYLVQGPPPTPDALKREGWLLEEGRVAPKTYLLHYVGDYDAAAWTLSQVPVRWNQPERGSTPLSWAINPNLAERAAPVFDYIYRTRSGLDSFQSGDSGAGYVNPTGLLPPRSISGLSSAEALWQRHCAEWFRRMNLTVTGFIINASSGQMTPDAERMFSTFSSDGIVLRDPSEPRLRLEGNLPCIPMSNEGLPDDPDEATEKILEHAGKPGAAEPTFVTCRSVLYFPKFYKEVEERLVKKLGKDGIGICDPRTFFYLARLQMGGSNSSRATFLFDTLERRVPPGESVSFVIAIRNDGWDTWEAKGPNATRLSVGLSLDAVRPKGADRIQLPHNVVLGDSVVLPVTVTVPRTQGPGFLRGELVRGDTDWFEEEGCLPLLIPIVLS